MSSAVSTLIERNARYAAREHPARASMMPRLKTIVISCVDPRVDPAQEFIASGLVFDVATGLVDQVVAPAPLRAEQVAS